MAVSIRQSQENFLATTTLEEIGEDKGTNEGVSLGDIELGLIELAIYFKVLAEEGLSAANAISTNRLSDSIQIQNVKYMGGTYTLDINVLDYYKFVDKGVQGVKNERGGNSPYKFKNLFVGKSMMQEIRKWLIREGLKARTRSTLKSPIGAEKKGAAFAGVDKTSAFAYAVARSIKKKGLRPTNFWTNAEKKVNEGMKEKFGGYFATAIVKELTNKQ